MLKVYSIPSLFFPLNRRLSIEKTSKGKRNYRLYIEVMRNMRGFLNCTDENGRYNVMKMIN